MCGLIGWVGDDPKKFTFSKLHTLGVLNETRGRHSCGISFDGEIWTGVNKEKLWRDFGPGIKEVLDEYPLQSPVVIGHTRWASVSGEHNSENAHPFGFGGDSKEGFDFCGAHNGTIVNIDELAKNFNIEKQVGSKKSKRTKIDSEILLEIIYKYGIDVLSQYTGGAALIWYDSLHKNTLYVFHGKSKMYPSSHVEVEERPLFWLKEKEGSLYISSLDDSLVTINDTAGEMESFEYNTLYKIVNGDIDNAEKTVIDRSKCAQKNSITGSSYVYGGPYGAAWEDSYPYEGQNCGVSNRFPIVSGFHGKSQYTNPREESEKTEKESREKENEKNTKTTKFEIINLAEEKVRGKLTEFKDVVYYNRLRYWKDDKVISGVFAPMKHNAMCYLGDTPSAARTKYDQFSDSYKFTEEPLLFYFYKGIALEKELDYNIVTKSDITPLGFHALSYMSKYPIVDLLTKDSKIIHNGTRSTDFFYPYLSKKVYTVSNGDCVDAEEVDEEMLYDDIKSALRDDDSEVLKIIKPDFPKIEVMEPKGNSDNEVVKNAREDVESAVDDAMELIDNEVLDDRTKEEALGIFQMIKDQIIQTFEKLWQQR